MPWATSKVDFRIVPQMHRIADLKHACLNTLEMLQQYRTAPQIQAIY
jgi:hypothetical protein